MHQSSLDRRERMLSIWVQGRLGERETVDWGISTVRQARGVSRQSILALFEFLEQSARAQEPPAISKVWRLLSIAAKETLQQDSLLVMFELREKIQKGTLRTTDIDPWINCIKPKLVASDDKPWRATTDREENDKNQWVHWSLKTNGEIGRDKFLSLTADQTTKISDDLLFRLIDLGTIALADALSLAQEIGWMDNNTDLSCASIHRVFPMEAVVSDVSTEDGDDPDQYNDGFAPLVRTVAGALQALGTKNPVLGAKALRLWQGNEFALFQRLYAFGAWNRNLADDQEVAQYLASLNDEMFWRWNAFPEIATLRAIRWNRFSNVGREAIEQRLRRGPYEQAFLKKMPPSTIEYYRDHEIARLVDNKLSDSSELVSMIADRRATDQTFPNFIPILEPGLPGPQFGFVPEGNPSTFVETPIEELLQKLDEEYGVHRFDRGDDAEAFARTSTGRLKILEALQRPKLNNVFSRRIWSLLLSYPSGAPENDNDGRIAAVQICRLALALPEEHFSELASRLAYWLDATDEKFSQFHGSSALWLRLLPFAVTEANNQAVNNNDNDSDLTNEDESDLTSAALNEPFGHLLSFFFRRCPTLRSNESTSLPQEFVVPLKAVIDGRASELLANRLCILIGYFFRVERDWVERLVILPMTRQGKESERLWEAFSKYARIPQPEIWRRLESHLFKHLTSSLLSPEAKKRLAEMCLVVWVWTKRKEAEFGFRNDSFRLTLELADDSVRGAVAFQFASSVGSYDDASLVEQSGSADWIELGRAFFEEVWPLEPALQSPTTANDFARIPARVRIDEFGDAVSVVLPYLLPFDVWSVQTGLWLDLQKEKPKEILKRYPNEVLTLLSAVIGTQQTHGVHDLKNVLDYLIGLHPQYQSDLRLRALRRVALG